MEFPVTVTFRNTRRSPAAESLVTEQADRISKYNQRITNCEVLIDVPHHHHHKGNEFYVRVLLNIPGHKVIATSHNARNGDHTDLHIAIRDSFDLAARQLRNLKPREKHIRKFQKAHADDGLSAASAIG